MKPTFSDIQFAVVYFTSDKTIYIYNVTDINGWNEDSYDLLKAEKNLILSADYDYVTYRVSRKQMIWPILIAIHTVSPIGFDLIGNCFRLLFYKQPRQRRNSKMFWCSQNIWKNSDTDSRQSNRTSNQWGFHICAKLYHLYRYVYLDINIPILWLAHIWAYFVCLLFRISSITTSQPLNIQMQRYLSGHPLPRILKVWR